MARVGITSARITTNELLIQWLPCGVERIHKQRIDFQRDINDGDFRLRVNGELSAAIDYATPIAPVLLFTGNPTGGNFKLSVDGMETASINYTQNPSTLASNVQSAMRALTNVNNNQLTATATDRNKVTLNYTRRKFFTLEIASQALSGGTSPDVTIGWEGGIYAAINTALNDLPTLDNGEVFATGVSFRSIELVSDRNDWYDIRVEQDQLVGNDTVDDDYVSPVTQQGSRLFTLSGEMSDFDWEVSIEDTDVTPINQVERQKLAVATASSFNIMLYRTETADFRYSLYEGVEGFMYVYPRGKIIGREYLVFPIIIDSYKEKYPDHEKVDVTIAGTRQGAWVVPPNSVYREEEA